MKYILVQAKSIFSKTKIPGYDFVINPYVGCQHACLYCYAKFVCRWKEHGSYGTWVEIKMNAAELVRGRYVHGRVCMASITDAYQPIEKKLMLTRAILQNMDKRIDLTILTKSDLVLRDLDVLKEFRNVQVGLTINGFSEGIKRCIEPNAPDHKARVDALKILNDKGMKNYAFISPFIPGIVDLEQIISETKSFVDHYILEFLNPKVAGQEFVRWLKDHYFESYEIINNKNTLESWIKEVRDILRTQRVDVEGIVTHQKGFDVVTL